jgi:hypothetical protein
MVKGRNAMVARAALGLGVPAAGIGHSQRADSERPKLGAELSHRLIMSIVHAAGVPDSDVTRLQSSNRLGAEGQNNLR